MDTNALLNSVLQFLLPPLVAVLAGFAFRYLLVKIDSLRSQIGASKWKGILDVVSAAVAAAEQSGLAGLIVSEGKAKKAFAIETAQKFLLERGINIDLNTLDRLIEAAVLNDLGWKKAVGNTIAPVSGG